MITKRFVPRPQVVYCAEHTTNHRALVGRHISTHGRNGLVSGPPITDSEFTAGSSVHPIIMIQVSTTCMLA